MMRAKAAIENFTKDRQAIIVTEIPYQVNKARLIERIAELVNDKIIDDISDIRDESDRDGMRIVIELKRGGEPQIVLNQLFKHTSMQESFSMIFLAVVNGQPKEMGLIQAIQHFIDHRVDVVRRRTAFLLAQGQRPRAHPRRLPDRARPSRQRDHHHPRQRQPRRRARKPGRLLRRQENRHQRHRPRAQARSRKAFTAIQADAILELQLHRLTRLSIDEITKELNADPRKHRRIRIDSRLREEAARRHRQRARRSQEALRRRAPHPSSKTKPPRSCSKT